MGDPVATGGAIIAAGWLGRKVLGPTADHYGEVLKSYAASGKPSQNIHTILQKAKKKLGLQIDRDEEVPPRVLKDLIFEGAFCEDDVEAEYRAGIIASSRSDKPNSDTQPFISLINRLSPIELKLHFILYSATKIALLNSDISPLKMDKLQQVRLYINHAGLSRNFPDLSVLTRVHILAQEGLINSNGWAFGSVQHLSSIYHKDESIFSDGGLVFSPSSLGCMLFMYANGNGKLHPELFFKDEWKTFPIEGLEILPQDIKQI